MPFSQKQQLHLTSLRVSGLTAFVSPLLALLLVLVASTHFAYASGSAPNAPGSPSVWTPSNNTLLGTAANTSSDVWFNDYNGIVGEVFYPTADTPNTTDLQFLIGDSNHTWVDEEKVDTTTHTKLHSKPQF